VLRPRDTRIDRGKEKEIDELGVELEAAPVDERPSRHRGGLSTAVRSPVRDRVEGVGDRDDACGEWDAPSFQATRISLAVPTLVVSQHAVGQIGIEDAERFEHAGANTRVLRDGTTLGRTQRVRLANDVFDCLVDLADVVEERDALDALAFMVGEIGRVGKDEGVRGDASDVCARIGVVGVDRVEE